jgi:hypothetical protein
VSAATLRRVPLNHFHVRMPPCENRQYQPHLSGEYRIICLCDLRGRRTPRRLGLPNWTTETWTAIATGVGALATVGTAAIIYLQVSSAGTALYGSNSYAVQKDLIEAIDRISQDEDTIILQGSSDVAKAQLKRQVARLDALFEAVEALYNNDGISKDTWEHILKTMCPQFDRKSYQFGKNELSATKAACNRGQKLWRETPR